MPQSRRFALTASGIRRAFADAAVLKSVSLVLRPGRLVLLQGRNGSGKTTLINCLTGFDRAYSGKVCLGDESIDGLPPEDRAALGVVRTFQQPHLFSELQVVDHLRLGRWAAGSGWLSYLRECGEAFPELVAELDLQPLLKRRGTELSLGEMKVVNIARALSTTPDVLLLDEPLASLHGHRRALVAQAIERRRRSGVALLVIEHVAPELLAIADATVHLVDGELSEVAS